MTKPQQDAARERCDKATPGPWSSTRFGNEVFSEIWSESAEKCVARVWSADEPRTLYDEGPNDRPERAATESFIAHVRTDLPLALSALAEKDARIAELESALKVARDAISELINGLGTCSCHEAFTSRKLRDPQCVYCDNRHEIGVGREAIAAIDQVLK